MSLPSSNSNSSRRKPLIKDSPFRQLVTRTEELNQVSLKDAYLVNIDLIELNPNQPRKRIDENRLQELSEDIKVRGILQPPIVRRAGDKYQLVVGERRYRAALKAELKEIPVLVQELTDQEAQIVSLVENIQREDLDFEDEAKYFKMLQEEYSFSIRDIAALVHKSKSYVDARIQLLKNPQLMKEVQAQKLGLHEATLLARLEKQGRLEARKGVREKDSSKTKDKSVREKDSLEQLSPGTRHFVRQCRTLLDLSHNMVVKLQKTGEGEREITIATLEQLGEELGRLRQRLEKQREL